MAAYCDFEGLQFQYPENWTLEELYTAGSLDAGVGSPQVVVSGPETAFWQLSRRPPHVSLEALFDEALAALRAEYREIEVEAVASQIEGESLEGYDVNFYYLDLTVTAWLRGFVHAEGVYLMVCQAEDRELLRVGPVFEAMLASLLRRLN